MRQELKLKSLALPPEEPKGKYTHSMQMFEGSDEGRGVKNSVWRMCRNKNEARNAGENQFHIKIQANFMRTFAGAKVIANMSGTQCE